MEQDEDYKRVKEILNELNKQLDKISGDEDVKILEVGHKQINDHFELISKALEERKEILHKAVDKFQKSKNAGDEDQTKQIKAKIETCNKILDAGITMYQIQPTGAPAIWKSVASIDHEHTISTINKPQIELPTSILEIIKSHGAVTSIANEESNSAPNSIKSSPPSEASSPRESSRKSTPSLLVVPSPNASPSSSPSTPSRPPSSPSHSRSGSSLQAWSNTKPAGEVTTIAGSVPGFQDGQGSYVKMHSPCGVVFNPLNETIFFCDYHNNAVRKLTSKGEVSSFAEIKNPYGIAFHTQQRCYYVSSYDHTIHKITSKGIVSLFAGTSGVPGSQDGVAAKATFNSLCGIAVNQKTGDVYVADFANHVIRKISPQGMVSTLAGTKGKKGFADGAITQFNGPCGICFHERDQMLIVCDHGNGKLRRVTLDGLVSTMREVLQPNSVEIMTNDALLVTSNENLVFRVIFKEKGGKSTVIEHLAGTGQPGILDGPLLQAQFNFPAGIAFNFNNNTCYLADQRNNRICKIKLV